MHIPKLFVDFQNADQQGRLRLITTGTLADIKKQNLELIDGMKVSLNDGETLTTIGYVKYSDEEKIWVAEINWDNLKCRDNFFDILIGEKLSSVTFVMDYMQVDFDGNRFTFYIYPTVTIENINYNFGSPFYRDKLCLLITKIVQNVKIVDNEKLTIEFNDSSKLNLSLDSNNPDIIVEIGTFTDTKGQLYVFR